MTLFSAAPFAAPTRELVEPTPLAVVRHQQVEMADMPSLFDQAWGALDAAVDQTLR